MPAAVAVAVAVTSLEDKVGEAVLPLEGVDMERAWIWTWTQRTIPAIYTAMHPLPHGHPYH